MFSPGIKPFKDQIYEDLKRQAQETQTLFEDPEFPANDSALFYKGDPSQLPGRVEWKRPKVYIKFLFIHFFNFNIFKDMLKIRIDKNVRKCLMNFAVF